MHAWLVTGIALGPSLAAGLLLTGCGVKEDPVQCGDELIAELGPQTLEDIQPLLEENCQRCHATSRTGAERQGAPAGANWDSEDAVLRFAPEIVERAAGGTMPPGAPLSLEDRCRFFAYGVTEGF